MAPGNPAVTAFSISDGKFCRVGSDDDVRHEVGTDTEIVDLEGKTVLPGFIESHNHMSVYAMNLLQVNCASPPNYTVDDIKQRIRRAAHSAGPGKWILGYGYDDTLITDKRHLTKSDLDQAAPHNPVQVLHISVHFSYVNSKALETAGITPATVQPDGGEIDKDTDGQPTGLLMEPGAMDLVRDHIPLFSAPQLKEVIGEAAGHFHRYGITSIHDGGIGYFHHGPQVVQAYQELEKEGRLNLRVYMTLIETLYRRLFDAGLRTGFGSEMLKLGCVKTWQDGSIQGYTGALGAAYHSRPDHFGELLIDPKELNRMVAKYHGAGCQVAIHANGDRAIDSVLDAFEAAQQSHPKNDCRHMIIHCQTATDTQLDRIKHLSILPNFFVNHVYYWGDRHESIFLGPERARRIDPLHSALQRGLKFCLHSDLPVTPVDPLFSIHTAVNRLTRQGRVLGPEERIPVLAAIKAYTVDAAYASFEEDQKGTIEPGKLADFVVLSDNPLEVPPPAIKDIRVLKTVVGGMTVFDEAS